MHFSRLNSSALLRRWSGVSLGFFFGDLFSGNLVQNMDSDHQGTTNKADGKREANKQTNKTVRTTHNIDLKRDACPTEPF